MFLFKVRKMISKFLEGNYYVSYSSKLLQWKLI